jgi:ATP synthase protein I
MATIAPSGAQGSEFDDEPDVFVPLTPEQAAVIRAANPTTSPWWVVIGQIVLGLLVVGLALVWFDERIAKSVACGVLAVVVPAALFARGLTSQFAKANVGAAVMSFFLWELVKIVVTLGILLAAHRLVAGLSWPAMLVGLVVAIKVYWLALAFRRKGKPVQVLTPHGKSN